MIQTFITSFKLKNTYRVNSIIYSIKSIPFIKRLFSDYLYHNEGLKIFANVISILYEIASLFVGKILYVYLMIYLIGTMYQTNISNTFLHIFTFLTFIGGFLNTYMFNPTKDKYYAISIMHMDAKLYALSNYGYSLLKVLIGFLPFTIIFGLMAKIPLILCMIMPLFVVWIKMLFIFYRLHDYEKNGKIQNENLPEKSLWILMVVLLGVSYGLPYLGIIINQNIFIALFCISTILGIVAFKKIVSFKYYKKMFQQLLTPSQVYYVQNQTSTQIVKESVAKQIEYDDNVISNKSGFAYFHDLFVKRHRKILTNAVKKQTIVIILISIVLAAICKWNPEIAKKMNSVPLNSLPYFVFIMYMLNRGTVLTQAMFMNCDHSMLTYRIYRTPKVILGLFKERLKTLMKLNFIPALALALGLSLLLYITGGTDNVLNYVILLLSIIAMSIFFSVHYLVMYYLLQPYDVNTELKSGTYKIVQTVTYVVCYVTLQLKLSTITFGMATIIFSIIYSFISLLLVYKFATKTFRIKI